MDVSSVGRVTEITSRSDTSFEDAMRRGIERASKTLRGVKGAWVKEQQVEVEDGQIVGFRVNMLVTFILDD
jgi:flavin-binding protein dodecin